MAVFAAALMLCHGINASVPQPSSPQEQAEFLAGIPQSKRSILYPLQKSPEYRLHQKELREQWTFCRKVRYEVMQQWAREHLARYPATRGVLRYLFGGPDFLNAFAFFPDTRIMVLGGLEPVGDVPPPEGLDPISLGAALKALEESLHTSLFCGYFITSEMKPQLSQGSFRGVLPVLYTELALTGNIIDSVSMIRPFGSPGVQINYHRPGGSPQTLFYFQADLSNGKECGRFLTWLGDLGPGASYLKAASYLLPLDSFSETRNLLTKTSSLILQDDSGLPFRCFLPGEWQIQLFGVYTDPLPIFRLSRDLPLDEAFHSEMHVGTLAFGAGYHVQPDDANLLLAVRLQHDGRTSTEIPQAPPPPPSLPAFAEASSKSKPIRIKKALPVPIKKAIAVPTPKLTPSPQSTPTPSPELRSTPAPQPIPESSPEATPIPDPEPTTTQAPSTAPTASPVPEAQPYPSPSGTTNENSAKESISASTPAPSPVATPVDPMPSSTPAESAQPSTTQKPQTTPEVPFQESLAPASSEGTTN